MASEPHKEKASFFLKGRIDTATTPCQLQLLKKVACFSLRALCPLTVLLFRTAGTCLDNMVIALFTATSSAFVFCGERDSESRSK